MKQIQIQRAITFDEAVPSAFAELIQLGVENGTKSMSSTERRRKIAQAGFDRSNGAMEKE